MSIFNKLRLSCLLAAIPLAAGCGKTEPAPQRAGGGAPPIEVPAARAAEKPTVKPFPPERLAAILAEMNAEGAVYEIGVTIEQLQSSAKNKLKDFEKGFSESEAKDLGLPAPERAPFSGDEKLNRGPRAKWLAGIKWVYGDYLPREGGEVTEAWLRIYGSRDLSSGDTIMIQTNVAKDLWVRQKWQPGKKRWSFYTEEEELAGMRNLLSTRYAYIDPADRNSARFEFERLQPAVEKARAAGRDPAGYQRTMRAALIRAFDKELEREALRYYIDNGGSAR